MKTRIRASEQSEQQAKLASHKLVYRRNYEPILTLSHLLRSAQFAMKEANSEMLKKMQEFNEVEVAAGEKAKKDMEEKVLKLENMLKEEREKGMNQNNNQRELELKLSNQMAETEKLLKRQERERQERSLIDRQLLHTLPLVHEANCISVELNKLMRFSVKLVSKTMEGELGESVEPTYKTEVCVIVSYEEGEGGGEGEGEGEGGGVEISVSPGKQGRRPSVYTPGASPMNIGSGSGNAGGGGDKKGRQNLWSHEKFHNRIYIMREMYHTWKEGGGVLEGTEFASVENDPFYDPAEDQLLGIARMQLEAMKYMLDVEEATPLVDYKGTSEGELLVGLTPMIGGGGEGEEEEEEDIEDLEEIIGKKLSIEVDVKSCRGLPGNLLAQYKSMYVQFRFFATEEYVKTGKVAFKSINPKINFKTVLKFDVSAEFCQFVVGASLGFECFLSTEEVTGSGSGSGSGSGCGGAVAKKKNAVEEGEEKKKEEEEEEESEIHVSKDTIIKHLRSENKELKAIIEDLTMQLETARGGVGKVVGNLNRAVQYDSSLN